MATTPARLRVPARCKLCDALGTVTPVTTITQGAVHQTWSCRACSNEWPVTRREQQLVERREGRDDRRRITRNDRRAK